jgi:peptidyl-prolyl cis-trans isomerase D
MRKHARFFYFLFFIVIITFIFWGVGGLDQPTSVSVAQIGEEKITVEEYWRAYENVRNAYRDLYQGKLDEEAEKKLQLKESVLNNLIEQRVLLLAAKSLGITVTDKELQSTIMRDPRFMRDGVFRKDVYFRTLELNRRTPEQYEQFMRRELVLQKMRRMIDSAVDMTPAETAQLPADEALAAQLKQALLSQKRSVALKSFVESMKEKMEVKINKDAIS